ncbi:MAG: polysaccharide deacetylase family protein [Acidobacteriota bacterium]
MTVLREAAARSATAVKNMLARGLASQAAWPAVAMVLRPTCVVLAYHRIGRAGDPFPHVEIEHFRAQMQWLRRHCTLLDVRDLRATVEAGKQPGPSVLITFDDGYRDYHEVAYPILRELRIPAVNFLPTHFIDHGGIFWWDAINLAVRVTRRDEVTLPWASARITLDAAGRRVVGRMCKDRLKQLMHDELPAELDAILDRLGVNSRQLEAERHVMTWDQVRATMALTTYGGHLHTHPLVSRIGVEQLEAEIRICRDRLAAETGTAPRTFAYPDGDVVSAAKPLLTKYGFETAFTIREGIVDADTDWLDILRYPGPPTLGRLAWLIARISGVGRGNRLFSG